MILSLMKYILSAALRDRLVIVFIVISIIGVSLSLFLGSSAITEKEQFAVVFASNALRFGSVMALILFVVFYIRKSFDARDVEYMLSRPISRLQYLLAHSFVFCMLSFSFAALATLIILLLPNPGHIDGSLLWGMSLFIELVIISNVALFFSFVLSSSVVATLSVLSFYVLSRMIGGILSVISAEPQQGLMIGMEKLMLIISMVIPRLDLMGQSSWLVFGLDGNVSWSFILLQGTTFYGLILSATFIDFKRKQF